MAAGISFFPPPFFSCSIILPVLSLKTISPVSLEMVADREVVLIVSDVLVLSCVQIGTVRLALSRIRLVFPGRFLPAAQAVTCMILEEMTESLIKAAPSGGGCLICTIMPSERMSTSLLRVQPVNIKIRLIQAAVRIIYSFRQAVI